MTRSGGRGDRGLALDAALLVPGRTSPVGDDDRPQRAATTGPAGGRQRAQLGAGTREAETRTDPFSRRRGGVPPEPYRSVGASPRVPLNEGPHAPAQGQVPSRGSCAPPSRRTPCQSLRIWVEEAGGRSTSASASSIRRVMSSQRCPKDRGRYPRPPLSGAGPLIAAPFPPQVRITLPEEEQSSRRRGSHPDATGRIRPPRAVSPSAASGRSAPGPRGDRPATPGPVRSPAEPSNLRPA